LPEASRSSVVPSKSTVSAPFILEETELELVELGLVQTIKTDDPLVSTDPFPSMVPIKRGLFIGGPEGTPFRSVHNHRLIGSGQSIFQEA
jgi:hypothetical protein